MPTPAYEFKMPMNEVQYCEGYFRFQAKLWKCQQYRLRVSCLTPEHKLLPTVSTGNGDRVGRSAAPRCPAVNWAPGTVTPMLLIT